MMHRRAESVDVDARLANAAVLLGRSITFRPDHRSTLAIGLEKARDAEVDQYNSFLGRKNNIRRFEIAKDDRLRLIAMQIVEHIADLNGPGTGANLVDWLVRAFKHRLEVAPG